MLWYVFCKTAHPLYCVHPDKSTLNMVEKQPIQNGKKCEKCWNFMGLSGFPHGFPHPKIFYPYFSHAHGKDMDFLDTIPKSFIYQHSCPSELFFHGFPTYKPQLSTPK